MARKIRYRGDDLRRYNGRHRNSRLALAATWRRRIDRTLVRELDRTGLFSQKRIGEIAALVQGRTKPFAQGSIWEIIHHG